MSTNNLGIKMGANIPAKSNYNAADRECITFVV